MTSHTIPVGALVEKEDDGVRLFVAHRYVDCDSSKTPLYCLAADPLDTQIEREGFFNATWVKGIPENHLRIIREPKDSPDYVDDYTIVDVPDMSPDTLRLFTRAMQEADEDFDEIGGGTRHYIRDCLWPAMQKRRLVIFQHDDVRSED